MRHPDAFLPEVNIAVPDAYTNGSPLRPFRHRVDGTDEFWTSEACKNISDLGYTYDSIAIPLEPAARSGSHVNTLIDGFTNTGQILMNAATESVAALKLATIQSEGDTGQVYADYLVSVLYDK